MQKITFKNASKWAALWVVFFSLTSCFQEIKPDNQTDLNVTDVQDTVLVKYNHDIQKYDQGGVYSKTYSYYWIAGRDTLDFVLDANEYKKDSTLYLRVHHKGPVLWTTSLSKIEACLGLIKDDFHLINLKTLFFMPPVYYVDMANKLSDEYVQQFGRRDISYPRLNQFLLASDLNNEIETLLYPLNKKVKGYGVEKFHLLNRDHFSYYLPDVELDGYPEFTIHGMGLEVRIEDRSNQKEKEGY